MGKLITAYVFKPLEKGIVEMKGVIDRGNESNMFFPLRNKKGEICRTGYYKKYYALTREEAVEKAEALREKTLLSLNKKDKKTKQDLDEIAFLESLKFVIEKAKNEAAKNEYKQKQIKRCKTIAKACLNANDLEAYDAIVELCKSLYNYDLGNDF